MEKSYSVSLAILNTITLPQGPCKSTGSIDTNESQCYSCNSMTDNNLLSCLTTKIPVFLPARLMIMLLRQPIPYLCISWTKVRSSFHNSGNLAEEGFICLLNDQLLERRELMDKIKNLPFFKKCRLQPQFNFSNGWCPWPSTSPNVSCPACRSCTLLASLIILHYIYMHFYIFL